MSEQQEPTQENDFFEKIVFVKEINAEQVEFGPGLAGRVNATQNVHMQQAGALAVAAGQDAEVSYGGALALAVGRDMKLDTGGGMVFAVGRDLRMADAGAGILNVGGQLEMKDCLGGVVVSSSARVEKSLVGVLFSNAPEIGQGNQILMTTPQAAALGAAFGFVFALMSWLLRKK